MTLSGLSVLVAFSEPLVYKRRTSNVNEGNIAEATVLSEVAKCIRENGVRKTMFRGGVCAQVCHVAV